MLKQSAHSAPSTVHLLVFIEATKELGKKGSALPIAAHSWMNLVTILFHFSSLSRMQTNLSATTNNEASETKQLLLIRHGRSLGNDMMDKPGNRWGDPGFRDDGSLIDSPLSDLGIQQAKELSRNLVETENIELIVVSPLTRTMQTMQHAVLPNLLTKKHNVPIIAQPLSTERVYTASDTGRKLAELPAEFQNGDINFDLVQEDSKWWFHTDNPGPEWRPHNGQQWYAVPGEPKSVFEKRIRQFERWLSERPEKYICLVGHWAVLRKLTNGYEFRNCEARWIEWQPQLERDTVSTKAKY